MNMMMMMMMMMKLARSFLIESSSKLLVTRTSIKAQLSRILG